MPSPSGGSTLMTSAPKSAIIVAAHGPAMKLATSRTLMPSSNRVIGPPAAQSTTPFTTRAPMVSDPGGEGGTLRGCPFNQNREGGTLRGCPFNQNREGEPCEGAPSIKQ